MSTTQSDSVSTKAAKATPKGGRTGGPEASQVPHPSVEERAARGRAARAEVPRSSHADFEPASRRPDPVELLASHRQHRACRSWCRSATGGCWCLRSRSIAGRR